MIAPEIQAAIDACADLFGCVKPAERRFELKQDLSQELAIKLWRKCIRPEGLRVAARNWVIDWLRVETRQREVEREAAVGARIGHGRRSAEWQPKWYPPHGKPSDSANLRPSGGDPFACMGARVMHVAPPTHGGSVNVVEDTVIAWIDTRIRRNRRSNRLECVVSLSRGR